MEGLMGMFEKFGTMITIFNPMYPLQFERFGDGNPDEDPEFKSHLSNLNQGHGVAGELCVDERFYSSVAIYNAEQKARMAYVLEDPVAEAKEALKISPYCPEAYNVLAQFEAKTYDEALGFYNKAVEVAPNVSDEFDKEVSERRCWGLNHLRSYFRAVHGQANTLRKLGRYEESLKKYLQLEKLDSKFYSWSSFANWRYHVLEVYMKMGDDKGALKFAHKKSNSEAFGLSSSCGAWFWTKALLDYRYKGQRGFAEDFFDMQISDDPESRNLFHGFEGTILRAFQASPETLNFLTGERKLPNSRIPFHMGNWASLSNVATYCLSNAELWRNTPGALEWAAHNARTFMCSVILNQDIECCKALKIKCSASQFEALISKGIFLDARVTSCGKSLVHVAVCNEKPQLLKMLLDAGAKVVTQQTSVVFITLLYKWQQNRVQLQHSKLHLNAFQLTARKIRGSLTAFCLLCFRAHVTSVSQASETSASGASVVTQHTQQMPPGLVCLTSSSELNYKPSKKYLESMKEFPGKRKLFAYYSSKLRDEEPSVIAEGPGVGRKPLSLMQPSSLSNFLSALGQFGDVPFSSSSLQKQLQDSKAILPKSATCENCKGREKKMMVCGQCRQTYYCSRECQKKNWKVHKKSCSPRRE
ncbi:hypothetical protein ACROYT_G038377 [Oculina patagonica]